ncbi:putative metal-dependent phosphoesterase TrpH [Sphingomonas sp. F9_3S_D5_B_2]
MADKAPETPKQRKQRISRIERQIEEYLAEHGFSKVLDRRPMPPVD